MNTAGSDTASQLPFHISVCGRDEISGFAGSGVTHLLSIDDTGTQTPTPEWLAGTHWHVVFDDVETADEARQCGVPPPTCADIQTILDYASLCVAAAKSTKVHLLVHCMAGISRSTAAMFSIVAMLLGPGKEEQALKYLVKIRREAFPNMLVVKLADDILKRKGKLLAAIRPLRERFDRM